jgi:hypothetical protein
MISPFYYPLASIKESLVALSPVSRNALLRSFERVSCTATGVVTLGQLPTHAIALSL